MIIICLHPLFLDNEPQSPFWPDGKEGPCELYATFLFDILYMEFFNEDPLPLLSISELIFYTCVPFNDTFRCMDLYKRICGLPFVAAYL